MKDIWKSRSSCFEDLSNDPESIKKFKEAMEFIWNTKKITGEFFFYDNAVRQIIRLASSEKNPDLVWRIENDIKSIAINHSDDNARKEASDYFIDTIRKLREQIKEINRNIKEITDEDILQGRLGKNILETISKSITDKITNNTH